MSPESRIVLPPNKLKQKVGAGGFDPKTLERAEKAIENNAVDFKPFARDMVKDLSAIMDDPAIRERPIDDVMKDILFPITQLNSHGAMFRYPSVSAISIVVIDFLEAITILDIKFMKIVEAYRNAVKALLDAGIMDTQNPSCEALRMALDEACARYRKSIEKI